MSIEEEIRELTSAVKENTAAHKQLGKIARATSAKAGGDTTAPAEKSTSGKSASKKATGTKAAAKKDDVKADAEVKTEVSDAELRTLARDFMSKDNDGETRDKNKANFAAALKHLGGENLSGVTEDDRPRLFVYITRWNEGEKVDFEEVDALFGGAAEAEEEMLG